MEVSPDSALSILESISSPQKLSRADRALYALLLTQARHKKDVYKRQRVCNVCRVIISWVMLPKMVGDKL